MQHLSVGPILICLHLAEVSMEPRIAVVEKERKMIPTRSGKS